MTQAEIRRAEMSDLDDVVALQVELGEHHRALEPDNPRYLISEEHWRAQIQAAFDEERSHFFVATLADKVCGFVRFSLVEKPWGLSCEMDTLVVRDQARGHGIGKLLVEAAEREGRSLGARAMRANVLVSNSSGRDFYKTTGYSEIAVRVGKPL